MMKVYDKGLALGNGKSTIPWREKSGICIETPEEWAAKHFGVPVEEVTQEQRMFAKRMRFGLIYGMGAGMMADRLERGFK